MNEEKLKDKFADILMGEQGRSTNKTLDMLIDAVYQALDKKRTSAQNNSLHLLFSQLSDECMEKGVEMRDIVRDEIPIPCTPENIKWLWKLLQDRMFKKKSTTELKKTGEIDQVYDALNKILIDRTQGEISLPPFPHNPERQKEYERQPLPDNYPSEGGDPDEIQDAFNQV